MKEMRRKLSRVLIALLVVCCGLWLSGVRLFAFPGKSMIPAVNPGDYFVGLVGVWGKRAPQRFEMLIFDVPPTSKWAEQKIPWLKRVVGLPGEHVQLSGSDLLIDGKRIESQWLHTELLKDQGRDFELRLGAGEYCVLGDNLDHSFDDSRAFGPVSRTLIRGRAVFVVHREIRPNKAPEPTPVSVTPRAIESNSR